MRNINKNIKKIKNYYIRKPLSLTDIKIFHPQDQSVYLELVLELFRIKRK